jgi:hypothetical protein
MAPWLQLGLHPHSGVSYHRQASTCYTERRRAKKRAVAGVLDEPYSELSPLSGVAVQARQST